MKYSNFLQSRMLLLALMFVSFALAPSITQAAVVEPICVLLLKSDSESIVATGSSDVMLLRGDELQIFWFSGNATSAEDADGKKISLSGKKIVAPTKKTSYSYTFMKGTKETTCSVTVYPAQGTVTPSTLKTLSSKPTVLGTAKDTKTVSLSVFKEGTKKAVYKSGEIKVSRGVWKHKFTDSLSKGVYTLVLSGSSSLKLNTISKKKLTIGASVSTDTSGVVVVQPIPLLIGGVVKRNQTVGLSYLQVLNVSLKPVTITGIRVKQMGTASTDTVLTLTATDDTEINKGQVGKVGSSPFKSNEALIPITLTIKAKETRLFTLKAIIGSDITDDIGDTLKLMVSGIESESSIKGTFPIKGVVWTLGN